MRMEKINLNILLLSNDERIKKNIDGILEDNRIIYIDEDVKTEIDLVNKKLNRDSSLYNIQIDFDNNICKYYLKSHNLNMDLNIINQSFIYNDNNIKIKYQIEDNIVDFKIDYTLKK